MQLGDRRRVWFLDELRGFDVILMVIYHALYDIVYIFGVPLDFFSSRAVFYWRVFIATTFMVISGISSHYSRNNLKRGLRCFGLAMALTLVTHFVMPSQRIVFGILHFLGLCMILSHFVGGLLKKVPAPVGIPVCLFLFFYTWNIGRGYLDFFSFLRVNLPHSLYSTRYLFPLGITGPGFYSADYYPLLPWVFIFLIGSFMGRFFAENYAPNWMYKPHAGFLAFIGRHAMVVYMLHQPIVYGVLWVYFRYIR